MFAYTASASRELDQAAQAAGTAGFELMVRAGQAVFDELGRRYPEVNSLLLFAGKGNNGGDAYIVAGLAARAGWQVRLWHCVGALDDVNGEAAAAQQFASDCGVVAQTSDPLTFVTQLKVLIKDPAPVSDCLIIDGLFGTGLTRAPAVPIAQLIEALNEAPIDVVALDVPSGLNATSGAAPGAAVRAALTVTFIGMKLGLLTGTGPDLCGERVLARLGVSERTRRSIPAVPVYGESVTQLLPRPPGAYKNQFGHLLLVGGDHAMGGAIVLAAEAALRAGAGLVSVATRPAHCQALLVRRPEAMAAGVDGAADLQPLLPKANGFVVGPGLGQGPWGEQLLQAVFAHMQSSAAAEVEAAVPLVVDADALNLVAQAHFGDGSAAGSMPALKPPPGCIMTPHPGEAARLLNCSIADVAADRVQAVLSIAETYGAFVVLKGVGSLIAAPPAACESGRAELAGVCSLGNPGMASAGMGDVLSGIVAALIAQEGLSATSVARAVQAHAAAGDRAADGWGQNKGKGRIGLLATDLIASLPQVLR